jgi:NTE family protein
VAFCLGPSRCGSGERLGLALSGGGFRAAFFHLGVLARLAELGILPKVEVISTVSGGSVIGAAYYLKVKRLLEETDGEPEPERYIELVDELDEAMRRAVARGVRGRIFANVVKNAEMLLPVRPSRRRYSRTDRLGDLLDRYLYKELFWGPAREVPKRRDRALIRCLSRDRQVELRELVIKPSGTTVTEPLRKLNRCRKAKIPELVINATSLNTGHPWRFEAIRMGEHVGGAGDPRPDMDGNRVLAPGYFSIAGVPSDPARRMVPEAQQDFPLSLAVAASAAVPGVFRALPISRMYSGVRVQLVDGGVADNQGIQALKDHGCARMIVSDASAQMDDRPKPRGSILPVLTRSPSILGDRVRDLQLARDPGNVHVVHLRKGLRPSPVEAGGAWTERVWPPLGTPDPKWRIHPRALDALSRIRTDLDTFSRREIDALACCGYVSIDEELAGNAPLGRLATPPPPGKRSFMYIEGELQRGDEWLVDHLVLGRRKFFRFLGPQGRLLGVLKRAFAVAVLAALAFMAVQLRDEIELGSSAVLLALLVLAVLLAMPGMLLAYRAIRGMARCLR